MKPAFALSLSVEGISLFHRAADGWRIVGDVAPSSDTLASDLRTLAARAELLAPGAMRCKVIIPNEQIRFMTVETGPLMGEAQRGLIEAELEGATPYALQELAFDIVMDGSRARVAAVARETLQEAEAFAVEHGFHPVSFVARPDFGDFGDAEPFFGLTAHADDLPDVDQVSPDSEVMAVVGPARVPAAAASPAPAAPKEPETADQPPAVQTTADAKTSVEASTAKHIAARDTQDEPRSAEPKAPGKHAPEPRNTQPVASKAEQAAPASSTAPPAQGSDPASDDVVSGPIPGFSSRRRRPQPDAASPTVPPVSEPISPDRAAAPAPVVPTPKQAAQKVGADPIAPPQTVTESALSQPTSDLSAATTPTVPVAKAKPSVAVTDPGLDLAAPPRPEPAASNSRVASLAGRFLNRRNLSRPLKAGRKSEPTPATKITQAKVQTTLPPPRIDTTPPRDEAERMTVFGARSSHKVGGKPRFLGLILTSTLLVFLAAVGTWAALFSDGGFGGLFSRAPQVQPDVAALRSDDGPEASPNVQSDPETPPATGDPAGQLPPTTDAGALPDTDGSSETGELETARLDPQDTPTTPPLSETDAAVLDALRDTIQPETSETSGPSVDGSPTAARYAATGIWPVAPNVPKTPSQIGINDVYLASIDRTDLARPPSNVPSPESLDTDPGLDAVASPAAAGTTFALDAQGLVRPTPGGSLTPDGITVFLGPPPLVPPARPERAAPVAEAPELSAEEQRLAGLRPRHRPESITAQAAARAAAQPSAQQLRLAGLRPQLRPKRALPPEPEKEDPKEEEPQPTPAPQTTQPPPPVQNPALAGKRPETRPRNFDRTVKRTRRKAASTDGASGARAASLAGSTVNSGGSQEISRGSESSQRVGRTSGSNVAGGAVKPAGPSPSSVTRQATLKNSINLKRLNLIGVYGTPSNRRALIRLPSGRYKKVKVGDLVDGGRIVAIGDSELRYQKGGRNLTLKMPKG